jgi:hypothetical protein
MPSKLYKDMNKEKIQRRKYQQQKEESFWNKDLGRLRIYKAQW